MKRIILDALSVLSLKERRRLLRLIIAQVCISAGDIASLALLLAVVHFYTQAAAPEPSVTEAVFLSLQKIHFLLPLSILALFFLLKSLASFFAIREQYGFIYGVASRISKGKMLEYLNGSYADYTQLNPSVHISRISYQPVEYSTFVLSGMQQMCTEATLTTLAIAAILLFNAKLFLLLMLILLPPVMLSAYFSKRRLNAARSHVKESAEKATQHLHEALAGYVESNVFERKSFFADRYSISQKKLSATLSRLQVTQALPPRLMELFAVFGLLILIVLNSYGGNASMELVNIGAFMAAAYKIIPGITRIANTSAQMRMYAYTTDAAGSKQQAPQSPPGITESIRSLAFRNVSFSHEEQTGIAAFNMELHRGDFAGISSDSGRGKTTIVNLLLGFLKPAAGAIFINGQEVAEATRRAYWPQVSYVKQQTFLIHDTLLQNITLEEGTSDGQRLARAIEMAGLNDFTGSFSEGLQKIISDNGKNISGGQRQRIAIARAFYKNADVIILDEPFNELDAAAEKSILRHLQEFAADGKIIILITHNSASLRYCNKIVSIHE